LINKARNSNHRVTFQLIGTKSNRAAIGARLTIHAAGGTQFNEVRAGGSYLSQNDLRLHFGLGPDEKMTEVDIDWPSGIKEVLHDFAADSIYVIREGQGIEKRMPLP
jgi:hypothetical protein